jgi:hypothetical protein
MIPTSTGRSSITTHATHQTLDPVNLYQRVTTSNRHSAVQPNYGNGSIPPGGFATTTISLQSYKRGYIQS